MKLDRSNIVSLGVGDEFSLIADPINNAINYQDYNLELLEVIGQHGGLKITLSKVKLKAIENAAVFDPLP